VDAKQEALSDGRHQLLLTRLEGGFALFVAPVAGCGILPGLPSNPRPAVRVRGRLRPLGISPVALVS
jgi:hypothetical protein